MSLLARFNSLRMHRPVLIYSLLFLIVFTALLIALRIALTPMASSGAISWLHDHGVEATIDDIVLDISDGKFILLGLDGKNADGNGIRIGKLELGWQWKGLKDSLLVVNKIELADFHIDALLYADGSMNIAGLKLPLESGDVTAPEDQPTNPDPFELLLTAINLDNISTCIKQFDTDGSATLDYCTTLGALDWQGDVRYILNPEASVDDLPLTVKGDFSLHTLLAQNNLLSRKLLSIDKLKLSDVQLNGLRDIKLQNLAVDSFVALQRPQSTEPDSAQTLAFKKLSIDDTQLSEMRKLSIGKIVLDHTSGYLQSNSDGSYDFEEWIPASDATTEKQATNSEPFSLQIASIKLDDISACIKQYKPDNALRLDYCTTLGALIWDGDISYTQNPNNSADDIPLIVKGDLSLNTLQAHNKQLSRKLISIDTIKLTGANVSGLNDIKLNKFTIETLAALQRSQPDGPDSAQALAFSKLTIDSTQLQNLHELGIGNITLIDAAGYLKKNNSGKFEFAEWIPASEETANLARIDTPVNDNTTIQYALGQFDYTSNHTITYIDNSLKEPFSVVMSKLQFELGPIDSNKPEALTHITLAANTGKHAKIKLDADINPLSEKPDLNGKATIAGLDLRALSPLTKQYIGHSIRSGQLDSDITLKADKGILDSKLTLKLNQFELRALNKKEAEALDSELGIPLNSSLSLLRDKDNRIKLEIPVTGDINNPDFNPADAITTATSKAISTAVLYYYTPFGLVLAADALFDLATALRFDPAVFEPGKFQLDTKASGQLDIISKMLTERPGVHLTLCGISNKSDTAALYPDIIKAAAKTESRQIILDNAQTQALLQLAEQRGNAVKDYLVNTKKIDASRLIVCEPEYQENADSARVDIRI
jgi:hypothetical protein